MTLAVLKPVRGDFDTENTSRAHKSPFIHIGESPVSHIRPPRLGNRNE